MEKDTALYLKFKNRGWCVWCSPDNELVAVPEDEKSFTENDLVDLRTYLYNEGFFVDYFKKKLDFLDNL